MRNFRSDLAIGFSNPFVNYGKRLQSLTPNKYRIELNVPMTTYVLPLYFSDKKPMFKNINVIAAAYFPFWLIISALTGVLTIVVALSMIVGNFYYNCLFRKSFITDRLGSLSGYISLALSLIGVFSIVKFFFF